VRIGGLVLALVLVVAGGVRADETGSARGRIVHTSDGSIYVSRADGTLDHRLTKSSDDLDPLWSPDGKKVAFLRSTDTSVELWVIEATGEDEKKLASDVALGFDWSPDSKRLVFSSASVVGSMVGEGLHLQVVDAATGVTEQLTHTDRVDSNPQWAPDGGSIVFVGGAASTGPDPTGRQEVSTDLFSVDPRSGVTHQLTNAPGVDHSPQWSADSRQIVFVSTRDDRSDEADRATEIYSMASDGTGERRITHRGSQHDVDPQWSPDGSKILYLSYLEDDDPQVRIAGGEGFRDRALTKGRFEHEWGPAWSPKGDWIAFTAIDKDSSDTADPELFVIPASGDGLNKLTTNDRFEWGPDWF